MYLLRYSTSSRRSKASSSSRYWRRSHSRLLLRGGPFTERYIGRTVNVGVSGLVLAQHL